MKTSIVGYTGFVGSNICNTIKFDAYYNSKNIDKAYNSNPDILVYSGVRAEMFFANKFPDEDLKHIENAIENIKKINPKRIVLISSIAVYNKTYDVDEDTIINKDECTPYGHNRRILEEWVENNYTNSLIVRLPGIYGINLKKNFIYDMINLIPSLLTEEKYIELSLKSSLIKENYISLGNGFTKCIAENKNVINKLKNEFLNLGFTALLFTDSRGVYQYFNLAYLWHYIDKALKKDIRILNLAVEPVTISEIYSYVNNGKVFLNELNKPIPHFDFKTKYNNILGGENGYLIDKGKCLKQIKEFIDNEL